MHSDAREYYEAADTLEKLPQLRPKLSTGTTTSLLDSLGDPHEDMTTVQIAGSNGKGSTARMLARILREAGLDVGIYTSPDLNDHPVEHAPEGGGRRRFPIGSNISNRNSPAVEHHLQPAGDGSN